MKDIIRKKLLNLRKKQTKNTVLQKSRYVQKNLFNLQEYKTANTILFYISYNNEVHTHEMIQESINKGKTIAVPVIQNNNQTLTISKLSSWKNLTKGPYNILQPKKESIQKLNINDLDLIIIPGVGFDLKGHRIGHGTGYYDKLLKNFHHTPPPFIGLAFELQILEEIPVEQHDIPVNKIVTEKRVIICKKD